jgi:hypothetical protein
LLYGAAIPAVEPFEGEWVKQANVEWPSIFRPDEVTYDDKVSAVVSFVMEQTSVIAAINQGLPVPTDLPRTQQLLARHTDDVAADPVEAWFQLPPDVRSLAEEDVPPGTGLVLTDVSVVLDVETPMYAIGLLTDQGVARIEVLPADGTPVPLRVRTVDGYSWRVVAYDEELRPVAELGAVPAVQLRESDALRLRVTGNGVDVTAMSQADFAAAQEAAARHAEPRGASEPSRIEDAAPE